MQTSSLPALYLSTSFRRLRFVAKCCWFWVYAKLPWNLNAKLRTFLENVGQIIKQLKPELSHVIRLAIYQHTELEKYFLFKCHKVVRTCFASDYLPESPGLGRPPPFFGRRLGFASCECHIVEWNIPIRPDMLNIFQCVNWMIANAASIASCRKAIIRKLESQVRELETDEDREKLADRMRGTDGKEIEKERGSQRRGPALVPHQTYVNGMPKWQRPANVDCCYGRCLFFAVC